jgi:hypothetical protein
MDEKEPAWVTGRVVAGMGSVPVISTRLSFQDRLGGFRVRWGIRRMHYRVAPGLYAVGTPDAGSPVLATANYKLTFDSLRTSLKGIHAWILVLDTKGVNVWCAAGKGTFGTDELVRRIILGGLSFVVNHRTIILPQLSAPGVAAHAVKAKSGFKVVYGPVRATDIRRFLEKGLKADPGMRTVSFTLKERLMVTPIELVQSWKITLGALLFWLLSWYAGDNRIFPSITFGFLPYLAVILTGSVVVPVILPWIPGRSLAFKGWLVGLAATLLFCLPYWHHPLENIAYLLMLPAVSSFLALNFTGATPYTSLSGVRKEMRIALPLLGVSALSGIILHLCGLWRIPWSIL